MEQENELRVIPDRPPRRCPVCNSRVAEGAKTCLMCGASLEEVEVDAEEEASPPEPSRRLGTKQIIILVGISVVILTVAVFLGLNLSEAQELPTFTPTLTPTSTVTPTPTFTPSPTMTPTPLPTPTPVPPQAYTVQAGDTLLTIADDFNMTVEELRAYNGLDSDIIVEGQTLQIPPPTPTPGPTPTLDPSEPTPTPAPFELYTVQSGDTLSTIAEEYDVSMTDIRAANDMGPQDTVIQAGDVLQIPRYTPTPEITPEIVMGGTPAPSISYGSPQLLYPPDDATFTGPEDTVIVQWASVGLLDDDVYYRVAFSAPTAEGPETTRTYLRATTWRVPETLFPAPELADRTCSWRVTVVRRMGDETDPNYVALSEPSAERTFVWLPDEP